MDEQNKDTEEQIKFTQLLKELADTQVTLAKINAQLAIRESKDQIETIVDSKSKELIEQAKKFGNLCFKELELLLIILSISSTI